MQSRSTRVVSIVHEISPPANAEHTAPGNAERGCVIWLTGLPAAGKTTIAIALEQALLSEHRRVVRLDGDDLRRGLSADLGFSAADRSENVRRAAAIASLFAAGGLVCIVALISPLRADRDKARRSVAPHRFIEVYVATPLMVCRQRDPKGLYARAERGEIGEFTGVSAPYEPPSSPEVIVHTDTENVDHCVARVIGAWRRG